MEQKVIRSRRGLNPRPLDDRGLMPATRPPGGLISSTRNMLLVPRRLTHCTRHHHDIAFTSACVHAGCARAGGIPRPVFVSS